jgi:hypothetical protein
VNHNGDGGRRQSHGEDHQARHWNPVIPQVPQGRVVGGVEQNGRDEKGQRELRRKSQRRSTRKKREQRAADREKHRVWRSHPARRRGQDDGRHEEYDQLFEVVHRPLRDCMVRSDEARDLQRQRRLAFRADRRFARP